MRTTPVIRKSFCIHTIRWYFLRTKLPTKLPQTPIVFTCFHRRLKARSTVCSLPSCALQSVLGLAVTVSQAQCRAIFFGGGGAVSLFFEQLAEQDVGFEDWSFLYRIGRCQVSAHEADGQGIIALGAQQHAGAIDQGGRAIEGSGLHGEKGLVHVLKAVGVAIESGEIDPGTCASVAGVDGGAKFPLSCGVVFVFLGDARDHPMRHGWIERRDKRGLGAGFVFSAADDPWSFQIELG